MKKSLIGKIKEHVDFNNAESRALYSIQSALGPWKFKSSILKGTIKNEVAGQFLTLGETMTDLIDRLVNEVKPLIEMEIL